MDLTILVRYTTSSYLQYFTTDAHPLDWLNMTSYYAAAFKTGSYPSVSKDQIFMWSRPHPALATAPDPVGPPTNHEIVGFFSDIFFVV